MKAEITISNYCNVYGDENDACFSAMEAGINYCYVSSDETRACSTAMEVGITKVITHTDPLMKMTCFSLHWKRE